MTIIFFLQIPSIVSMTQARHRKKRSNTTKTAANGNPSDDSKLQSEGPPAEPNDQQLGQRSRKKDLPKEVTKASKESSLLFFWNIVSGIVGVAFMVAIAFKHAHYMSTLHENNLWFSNIQVGPQLTIVHLIKCVLIINGFMNRILPSLSHISHPIIMESVV